MRYKIKTVRDTWIEDYGESGLIIYDTACECDSVIVLGPVDQDDMNLAGLILRTLEERHEGKPEQPDPTEDED